MTNSINQPDLQKFLQIIVITGALHSGKSTLVQRLVDTLRSRGYRVAGILTRGFWQDDIRSRFEVENLTTGVSTALAVRQPVMAPEQLAFKFFPEGIEAGMRALDVDNCRSADVIAVDEIGKLELTGGGWASCLDSLQALTDKLHIWVVRSFLLEEICRKWRIRPAMVVDCGQADALERLTRESERILSGLCAGRPSFFPSGDMQTGAIDNQ